MRAGVAAVAAAGLATGALAQTGPGQCAESYDCESAGDATAARFPEVGTGVALFRLREGFPLLHGRRAKASACCARKHCRFIWNKWRRLVVASLGLNRRGPRYVDQMNEGVKLQLRCRR